MKTLAFLLYVSIGCFIVSCSQWTGNGTVIVSSTKQFQSGLTKSLNANVGLRKTLLATTGADTSAWLPDGLLSITPTSMKVPIDNLMLIQGNGQGGDWPYIYINKTIELVGGNSALNDILQQNATFSQKDAGTYDGMDLAFGDSISVSGTFTYNGVTHSFADKKIFNAFGLTYFIPSTSKQVVVAKDEPVTIRLIFDVENAVALSHGVGGYLTAALDDGKTSVGDDGVMMMPFVGTQAPTVEKYLLKIQEDSTVTMTITIVRDESGQVCNFGWKPGFNVPTGNSPPVFNPPEKVTRALITSNSDGSYSLASDSAAAPNVRNGRLPAFRLENHSGLFLCTAETGGWNNGTGLPAETFHYTAVKEVAP